VGGAEEKIVCRVVGEGVRCTLDRVFGRGRDRLGEVVCGGGGGVWGFDWGGVVGGGCGGDASSKRQPGQGETNRKPATHRNMGVPGL